MPQQRLHVVFKGRVQGVGFRYTVHGAAGKYALTGWVRNCPDGHSVESELQGNSDQLASAVHEIQEYFKDNIRDTQVQDIPLVMNEAGFEITYS